VRVARDWGLVILWMAVIFWGSSRSVLPGPLADTTAGGDLLRSAVHVAEYAILAALTGRAATASAERRHADPDYGVLRFRRLPDRRLVISVLMIAAGYALFDELHQSFVPGRCFSLVDLTLDIVGAVLALGLMVRLRERAGQAFDRRQRGFWR